MTFPASPTFGQIRDEVLTELSVNRTGSVRKHILDQVDRYIKSEHTQIYKRFLWARRNIVFEVELTAGVNNYEFPDLAYPGSIEFVWAVNVDGDDVVELDRLANPRHLDPYNQREVGPPLQWWIENEKLVVGPAPSDQWPTLRIQTKSREDSFSKVDDRCQVDPELLILNATVRGLRFFEQHAEADRLEAKATLYAQDVAGQESSDQKIILGQARHAYPSQSIAPFLGQWGNGCRGRRY